MIICSSAVDCSPTPGFLQCHLPGKTAKQMRFAKVHDASPFGILDCYLSVFYPDSRIRRKPLMEWIPDPESGWLMTSHGYSITVRSSRAAS